MTALRRREDRTGGSVGVEPVVPSDNLEGGTEGAAPICGLGDLEDGGGTLWRSQRNGFMG